MMSKRTVKQMYKQFSIVIQFFIKGFYSMNALALEKKKRIKIGFGLVRIKFSFQL